VGSLYAFYTSPGRIRPEDMRVVGEAASLVSAQVALAALETQGELLARAELRALRAQISPHFVYNALTAVANSIHTSPDEARELLTEFSEFIRYAFARERPYVTLADELQYVEKYLRLEQARFGERLRVRVEVAPEVLHTRIPALSVQPLVENAIRHGLEMGIGGSVEIVASDFDREVELRVVDDGAGMPPERAAAALAGDTDGIGLANVHRRLQTTFGDEYGLEIESRPGGGTSVVMTLPKGRAGVRVA
jgi:two-component system LytT family sensor kinase